MKAINRIKADEALEPLQSWHDRIRDGLEELVFVDRIERPAGFVPSLDWAIRVVTKAWEPQMSLPLSNNNVDNLKSTTAIIVPQSDISKLTPHLKLQLVEEIKRVFDPQKGRYRTSSDSAIADRNKVDVRIVAQLREEFFGPIKINNDVQNLIEQHKACIAALNEHKDSFVMTAKGMMKELQKKIDEDLALIASDCEPHEAEIRRLTLTLNGNR